MNYITSIFLFLSINSFSQKVTYKDLIGTIWMSDRVTSPDSILYTFLDSTHYTCYSSSTILKRYTREPPSGIVYTYSLDTNGTITLWHLQGYDTGKDEKIPLDRYIELIDPETIKVTAKRGKKFALLKKLK